MSSVVTPCHLGLHDQCSNIDDGTTYTGGASGRCRCGCHLKRPADKPSVIRLKRRLRAALAHVRNQQAWRRTA